MSSSTSGNYLETNVARIEKYKYYDNTKGNTLVTNSTSEVRVVPPGVNDQILVADSTNPLGVKWFTVPSNVSIYVGSIVGAILTYSSTSSYSLFNPHTVTLADVAANYVEMQFIYKPQTLLKFIVYPASNYTWPLNSNFTFSIGYLRNLAGVGSPDAFSTISGTTNSYVQIPGTNLVVDNSFSGTRNPAILTVNLSVTGPEYICIRCINSTNTSGLIITANIIMRAN